jgi:L-lysine 6-oxidase
MGYSYRIEPSIGVARVGDSEPGDSTDVNYFYLSPETIGGRPLECDVFGITATPTRAGHEVQGQEDAGPVPGRQVPRHAVRR